MITVNLRDGCFPLQYSATLAGDAAEEKPNLLEWRRIKPGEGAGETVVFTDFCLEEAPSSPAAKKIAWLIEPPSINPTSYQTLRRLRGVFDVVFTHQHDIAKEIGGLWYPFGGSRIPAAERIFTVKERDVCIIASEKRSAPGHRLRHKVIDRFGAQVDAYGPEYGGAVAHRDTLPLYRFAIVIENERSADWLTEKLIDCLLVGTVPLYWGAPAACDLFNERAIWNWETFEELESWLTYATPSFYELLSYAIADNALAAQRYVCVEDWIAAAYPDILR